MTAALSAPAGGNVSAWAGVDLAGDGYMVVRVNRVLERDAPSAEVATQELAQLGQMWAQAEAQAYLQALRAHYKVQITAKKGDAKAE